ncbi:MAG: hypothetical protein JWR36_2684 [Glaciihabitans sp.]|nr:hypothetical protein [Glaciihabitans sp.]MDQ1570956.1 hypothetical protein [Actinomycetota bacterium]
MTKSSAYRNVVAVVRVVVAALIVAAVVAQLERSIQIWHKGGLDVGFQLVNFFSFFTIESNIASVVVLLIGAGFAFAKRDDPRWYTIFRVIVVTYMGVTGVVYNLLLRGVELPQGTTVEWSNEILHVVACAYLVLDWLFAPGRSALSWRVIRIIVIFPIVWAAYTLIRAPFAIDERTGKPWYPYPFLNPALATEGYFSVGFYVVLIAVIVGLVGAGAVWVSRNNRPFSA